MRISLLAIGAFLASWIPATEAVGQPAPLFVNGDFEDGTFNGWTLVYGYYEGDGVIDWGYTRHQFNGHPEPRIIGPGEKFSCQTLQVDPYQGTRMARINDCNGQYHATMLTQTAIVQEGQERCGRIEVQWGAMLVEPSNRHERGEQPFFLIEILINGFLLDKFEAVASDGSGQGWINAGNNGGTLWYKHDVYSIDLQNLRIGDQVTITMAVTDCSLGGHGGFAFLDGITNKPPSPKQPVNNPPIGKITKQIWGIGGSSYDTVILSNGEYYLTETDLKIPGRGFDFEFTRTYRSRTGLFPMSCDDPPPETLPTPLGYGWDFNYNMRLRYNSNDGSYTYFDGSGRIDVYNAPENRNGPPPGYYDQFLEDNPGQSVRIIKKDGTEFSYQLEADGLLRLASILDRNGNRMTFDYDVQGRLTTIHDTLVPDQA